MLFKNLIYLFMVINVANCAKILAIFWTPSQSHIVSASPILRALALKGHDVHVMSNYQESSVNIPTYHQVPLTGMTEHEESYKEYHGSIINQVFTMPKEMHEKAELFWKNQFVQDLLMLDKNLFDVVICLAYFSDHIFPIAHYLGAPLIVYHPSTTYLMDHKYVGAPNLPYYPHPFWEQTTDTIYGRAGFLLLNFLSVLSDQFIFKRVYEGILDEHLPSAPFLWQLNISLILVNTHPALEPPRPFVPNIVPIGGHYAFHPDTPIKKEFTEFLDSAENGAVVFSMGANVAFDSYLILSALLGTFAKFPRHKFLVKSDKPGSILIPKNVMVVKWIDLQANVLGHRNVKVLITSGGINGITEALFHAVPILGIPFTGEQEANINFGVKAGYAKKLEYRYLTERTLGEGLADMLNTKKFEMGALYRSSLLRHQPINPVHHAVWWIEHIIENKGGDHLKNVAVELGWYELYMVDVVLFYVLLIAINVYGYPKLADWASQMKKKWDSRPRRQPRAPRPPIPRFQRGPRRMRRRIPRQR